MDITCFQTCNVSSVLSMLSSEDCDAAHVSVFICVQADDVIRLRVFEFGAI